MKFVNINQFLATCKRTQNQLLAQQCWELLANNVTSFAQGLIPADKIVWCIYFQLWKKEQFPLMNSHYHQQHSDMPTIAE